MPAEDGDLQQGLRGALASQDGLEAIAVPSARSMTNVLKGRPRKLLDLYSSDSIRDATFSAEEKRLYSLIAPLGGSGCLHGGGNTGEGAIGCAIRPCIRAAHEP